MAIFSEKKSYDVESGSPTALDGSKHRDSVDETGAVPGEMFTAGNSTYAKLQRFAGRFNIEQRGIERVPETERTDKSVVKVGTMVSSRGHLPRAYRILTIPSGAPQTW